MESLSAETRELATLLGRLLDGTAHADDVRRLQSLLHAHPALIRSYVRLCRINAELRCCLSRPEVSLGDSGLDLPTTTPAPVAESVPGPSSDHLASDQERINRIRQRAEQQLQAFLAEQERQRLQAERLGDRRAAAHGWDLGRLAERADTLVTRAGRLLVTLAACAAVVLIGLGLVHAIRMARPVATLSASNHAAWSEPPVETSLRRGPLELLEGYAELTFEHGAQVLVQAPCRLVLQSPDRMFVEQGRIAATVPPSAVGFTVETATSSVQDFGTEFGVGIDGRGHTEVHVYQGRVRLNSPGPELGTANQVDLTENRAAILDGRGQLDVTSLQSRPNLFVRRIPRGDLIVPGRALSLADMVGRGNGLGTGVVNSGLSLIDGTFVDSNTAVAARANGFLPTIAHEFIDGVFIPDAAPDRPLVISSTGLTYDRCPDTSGLCVHMIRDGALFRHGSDEPAVGQLRGQVYGAGGHPAIGMHANAGITFDLDRIRAVYPNCRITRFTSLAGISETVTRFTDGVWKGQRITVGFRVLVDGRERFAQSLTAVPAQCVQIDLPLTDDDRFLTLITLEGHWDRPFAWSLFGDPRLQLEPRTAR